jgi:hypothetical protein
MLLEDINEGVVGQKEVHVHALGRFGRALATAMCTLVPLYIPNSGDDTFTTGCLCCFHVLLFFHLSFEMPVYDARRSLKGPSTNLEPNVSKYRIA